MSTRRIALYAGGASLLVAWLSSASSSAPQPAEEPAAGHVEAAAPADLAGSEVQAQIHRLKERLATAARPQAAVRNPFAFNNRAPQRHAPGPVRAASIPFAEAIDAPEPSITLIGLAEHERLHGTVRTAMIVVDQDQLIMAAVGDTIAERYTVKTIGAASVDLVDGTTGRQRRLTFQ